LYLSQPTFANPVANHSVKRARIDLQLGRQIVQVERFTRRFKRLQYLMEHFVLHCKNRQTQNREQTG